MPIDKTKLTRVSQVHPIQVEKYEQYMTASQNPSVVQKINDVIQSLHQMGRLTNKVVSQWNAVMDWVVNEGLEEITTKVTNEKLDLALNTGLRTLTETVANEKITELLESGQFEQIVADAILIIHNEINETLVGFEERLTDVSLMTGISISDFPKLESELDDTLRIQRAIDFVESKGIINTPDWANMQTPTLVIPDGTYIVSGLIISKPITVIGSSYATSIIKSDGSNQPIITVRGYLKSEGATAVEDLKNVFKNISIIGSETSGYDNPFLLTEQMGIKLDNSDVDLRHYARIVVDNCSVRHCGSHGIYLTTSVSNRILNSVMTLNSGDGIYMAGKFVTDVRITNNAIRRNRIGINIVPDSDSYITTGLINANTIESNRNGSGFAGSTTRPACGMKLIRTQFLTVRDNYFERHLNDVYIQTSSSFNRFENNYHDASSNLVPNYEGYAPIVRQVAPYYFEGTTNYSNVLEKNRLFKPIRPATVTPEKWGTERWGDTYPHIPVMTGTSFTQLIRNFAKDDTLTGQLEDIQYVDVASNSSYEGIFRNGTYNEKKNVDSTVVRKGIISITDTTFRHNFESETTVTADIPRSVFINPSIITNPFKRFFSYQQRNPDKTLTPMVDVFGINVNGELSIPLNKPLSRQYAAGNYFTREFVGTAIPLTGDYTKGDSIINRNPSAGGYMGWVCVTTGSPGIWKGYGLIES